MSNLQHKPINIKDTQLEVIKDKLEEKQRKGEIRSEEEYKLAYTKLTKDIEPGTPIMKIRYQQQVTDADSFNACLEELDIDLNIIFRHLAKIEETMDQYEQLSSSTVNEVVVALKKINDELDVIANLADDMEFTNAIYETFRDISSFTSEKEFTDRDGSLLPASYSVQLDANKEAIKLPVITSFDAVITPSGTKLATIKIRKQTGRGMIRFRNPENTIEKALDGSRETYWSETIFTDKPFTIDGHGAFCTIEIDFDFITTINEITIVPFTRFPMYLNEISYCTSDDPYEQPKPLLTEQRILSDTISLEFGNTTVKRLFITLQQEHYTKEELIISSLDLEKYEFVYGPDDIEYKESIYQDRLITEPERFEFLYSIDSDNQAVDVVITNLFRNKNIYLTKYQYQYGLRNIEIRRNEYADRGIYISKPLPVKGVVKSVTLEVDEEHIYSNGRCITDIEYFIGDGDNWYPMMSINHTKIDNERLFPQAVFVGGSWYYRASTRFVINTSKEIKLFRNGVKVPFIIIDSATIEIPNYKEDAIYTLDYYPVGGQIVDFEEMAKAKGIKTIEESFNGTDNNGAIELSYYPYVDRKTLNLQPVTWDPSFRNGYCPIVVRIMTKDGQIYEQPLSPELLNQMGEDVIDTYIFNKTNYHDYSQSILDEFTYTDINGITRNRYQYRVDGRKIIFNTPIPADSIIIVEYPCLVKELQVKAIMRRNIPGYEEYTPYLHSFKLKYNTID